MVETVEDIIDKLRKLQSDVVIDAAYGDLDARAFADKIDKICCNLELISKKVLESIPPKRMTAV